MRENSMGSDGEKKIGKEFLIAMSTTLWGLKGSAQVLMFVDGSEKANIRLPQFGISAIPNYQILSIRKEDVFRKSFECSMYHTVSVQIRPA